MQLPALLGFDPKLLAGMDPKLMAGMGVDPKLLAGMDPKLLAGIDPKLLAGMAAFGISSCTSYQPGRLPGWLCGNIAGNDML